MEITSQQILESLNTNNGRLSLTKRELTDTLVINPSYERTSIELTEFIFTNPIYLVIQDTKNCSINFSGSVFQNTINITVRGEGLVIINLSHCEFNSGLEIESNNTKTEVIANYSKADGTIQLGNSSFSKLLFNQFQFRTLSNDNRFNLESANISNELSFNKSYLGSASFIETIFSCKAKFDGVKFDESTFYNATFKDDLYFNGAELGKHIFFNGSTFDKKIILVQCNNLSDDCTGDFSGCIFSDEVYFNFSRFNSISFKNCSFNNIASFKDSDFKEVEFERCFFSKGADFSNTKYPKGDRESFRLIRSELLKVNNKFESLYYHSKELSFYQQNLSYKTQFGEKSMLWLNRISTNHGLIWTRGVLFTLGVAILFYSFYLLALPIKPFKFGWVSWKSYISATDTTVEYFLRFLNITHDFDFMKQYSPNSINYLLDFMSKIFIGYGIYQTIQAFRKYGKTN